MVANKTVYTGRDKILSSLEPTLENIPKIINDAMKIHKENAREILTLKKVYLGEQDILNRTKEVRPDINNTIVIDYALSTTRDIVGYTYGKPLQYVSRKGENREDVKMLNDFAATADKEASDQTKATNCSIFGIAHRGIFPSKSLDDDMVPYKYVDLDSEATFVVYSTKIGNPEILGCTYITEKDGVDGDKTRFYVYTDKLEAIYEIKSLVNELDSTHIVPGSVRANVLGFIPIIETENNQFRMGHWEAAMTIYDAINLIASDSVNDVVQFVNSILVVLNAELDEETMNKIRLNKFMSLISPDKGITADAKYIAQQLDATSVKELRTYLEEAFRIVVGVPDRKTRGGGGGDTGDAVELRDGWADIEIVARTTEMFFKKAEKKELNVVLKILKSLNKVKKDFNLVDIDIKMSRNKRDNLNNKVTAMATMVATKLFAPEDIVEIGDITTNVIEVVERGKAYQEEAMQKSLEQQEAVLNMSSKYEQSPVAKSDVEKQTGNTAK